MKAFEKVHCKPGGIRFIFTRRKFIQFLQKGIKLSLYGVWREFNSIHFGGNLIHFNRRERPSYFIRRGHFGCFDLRSFSHFSDFSGLYLLRMKMSDPKLSSNFSFRLSRLVRYAGQWEEVFVSFH